MPGTSFPFALAALFAAGEKVRMRGSRRQRFDESLAGQGRVPGLPVKASFWPVYLGPLTRPLPKIVKQFWGEEN